MLKNNKYLYLGATLFSAVILTSLSGQNVKADTVATSNANTTSNSTITNSSVANDALSTLTTTKPATTTSSTPTQVSGVTTTEPAPVASSTTTSVVSAPVVATTSTTTSVASAPATATSSSATSTPVTTATSTASTPVTTMTSSTTSVPATATKTGTTSSTTTSTTTASITLPGSGGPVTTPTQPTTGTGTTPTTTPSTDNEYAIPSNITNSTIVPFADPNLAAMVRQGLYLKPGADITVGDIRNFTYGGSVQVNELTFMNPNLQAPKLIPEEDYTPIESLDGLQYLKLLPAPYVDLEVRLGSDAKANPDLTPLNGLGFNTLKLIGNFSDPSSKEIDVNQITKLNVPKYGAVMLQGDKPYNGINNDQLKTLAPWLIQYSNGDPNLITGITMYNNSITDYTPLKNINRTQGLNINNIGGDFDPTPVYAVKNQPLFFKAEPTYGFDGEDLSGNYHFTTTVPDSDVTLGNLDNLGNDQYEIKNPDSTKNILTYGDTGFGPNNPTSSFSGLTFKKYGTAVFLNVFQHSQPIIWQDHPNVTINYLDQSGKPIMVNGTALTKTVDGVNIGDKFDLSTDTSVAGYTLTSPATAVQGAYTQNPQVINLTYSKNPEPVTPVKPTTPSKTPGTDKVPTPSTSSNRIEVESYNVLRDTPEDAALIKMGVKATGKINGELFYQIGYGRWVAASEFNVVKSTTAGVVRTFERVTNLIDKTGQPVKLTLLPNTAWKYSRIMTINGNDYYQVSTNEFLPVADPIIFTPTTKATSIELTTSEPVYNSEGVKLPAKLTAGSSWRTDGSAIINGVKMYRIATNEWVAETATTSYQPTATVYRATASTVVYDKTGKAIARKLAVGSAYKADRIVVIDGLAYYRIATNEFVRV